MKRKIKSYYYSIVNLLIIIWSKIIIFFGYQFDKSIIPKGTHYCYLPDNDKNNCNDNSDIYYTIPCKYRKYIGKGYVGCQYLGVITNDLTFEDACKICGENYEK